jgi:hypothetical protein
MQHVVSAYQRLLFKDESFDKGFGLFPAFPLNSAQQQIPLDQYG